MHDTYARKGHAAPDVVFVATPLSQMGAYSGYHQLVHYVPGRKLTDLYSRTDVEKTPISTSNLALRTGGQYLNRWYQERSIAQEDRVMTLASKHNIGIVHYLYGDDDYRI
jgi:hypothetical protein